MSLRRYAARRDATEPAIVSALRKVGAYVQPCSDPGVCDLLVLYRNRLYLLEVKTGQGKATPRQAERTREGWPYRYVRSVDDALRAIGVLA